MYMPRLLSPGSARRTCLVVYVYAHASSMHMHMPRLLLAWGLTRSGRAGRAGTAQTPSSTSEGAVAEEARARQPDIPNTSEVSYLRAYRQVGAVLV